MLCVPNVSRNSTSYVVSSVFVWYELVYENASMKESNEMSSGELKARHVNVILNGDPHLFVLMIDLK